MIYKSYITNLENLNNTLDQYGVAVIPNIITDEECEQYKKNIWDSIHSIYNPFLLEDETSWKSFYNLLPLHSMLIQHYGVGHIQGVWDIRSHRSVQNVFSKIHDTTELLSSFDGISIALPPEKTGRGWYRGNDWLHTDQSPKNKTFCIQGLVNLYDVNEYDATLTILEGSHKYHEQFFKDFGKSEYKDDWYKLEIDEKTKLLEKFPQYCVLAPKGSIILWNSKTFHQGIEAQKERKEENFRMAVYTCLRPKSQFNNMMIRKRQKAFNELRLTNHWGTHLFSKHPRTYGNELPITNNISNPILSEYGKSLIPFS